jgi:PAS domain S-box-containing protein
MSEIDNRFNKTKKINIKHSKILLLLDNKRNVELLSRFLDTKYDCYAKFDQNINFDLILVDSFNYLSNFKLIKDFKKKQTPIFLPVILLHQREDTVDYTSKKMNIADEFILTPVKKDVLKIRIKRLLELRKLTKENYNLDNKYKTIFNNISEMTLVYKINFKNKEFHSFIDVNKKVIEITGYKKEELMQMSLPDLLNYERNAPFFNYYFNGLDGDNKVLVESQLITKDKKIINIEIKSKIFKLNEENLVLSEIRNIT